MRGTPHQISKSSYLKFLEVIKEKEKPGRSKISAGEFEIRPGDHPIIPIMVGDASVAKNIADQLLEEGIYVIAFSYPVVPMDTARIRIQISAAHETANLDRPYPLSKKSKPVPLSHRPDENLKNLYNWEKFLNFIVYQFSKLCIKRHRLRVFHQYGLYNSGSFFPL